MCLLGQILSVINATQGHMDLFGYIVESCKQDRLNDGLCFTMLNSAWWYTSNTVYRDTHPVIIPHGNL